jgi:hypothetical protein
MDPLARLVSSALRVVRGQPRSSIFDPSSADAMEGNLTADVDGAGRWARTFGWARSAQRGHDLRPRKSPAVPSP